MIKKLLNAAINRSPKDNFWSVRRRLLHRGHTLYDAEEVFRSTKHMRSQRLYDFFHRYNLIAGHHTNWVCPDLSGSTVVELGPGPLLGWGPLTVFHQCNQYFGIEPQHNQKIIDDPRFTQNYLVGVHSDLCAIRNDNITFEWFQRATKEKITICKTIEELKGHQFVDFVLSNSCLEHIKDLKSTISVLFRVAKPGSCFLHCVDFGNHISKKNPFDSIYSSPVGEESYEKFQLNLIRRPDLLDLFRSEGFEVECVPYYWGNKPEMSRIHSTWLKRYSVEDLTLRVAIIVGKKPE